MKLETLLAGYSAELFGDPSCDVTSLQYDSRFVKPGAIFAAVSGFSADGHDFIESAVKNGASAVLSEKNPFREDIPWIKVDSVRRAMAELSAEIYGVDIESIKWVGVTGTNGKTTVATLFDRIAAEEYGRNSCWQFGTIGNRLGSNLDEAVRTTPEAVDLFHLLGTNEKTPKLITMEVSSHALELERIRGIYYDVAIFTNLTQDHLDFHGDMETYYQAKLRLFTEHLRDGGTAVINIDDPYGERLAGELGSESVISCGRSKDAAFRISSSHCSWDKTFFRVGFMGERYRFEAPLAGHFNIQNMAVTAAAAFALGISYETIEKVFKKAETVHGRMDLVSIDAPFTVVVDYAHTPDALKNTLFTAGKLTAGRVITVFGAGGDRDRSKRPLMGEMVARNADFAIVTSDNPRSENSLKIIDDICEGIPTDFPVEIIENRREAIYRALSFAREGDSVIIAGKGHETYQEVMGIKEYFDDRETVISEWRKVQDER